MRRAPLLLAVVALLFGPALLHAQDAYTVKIKIGGKGVVTVVTREESFDNRAVIALPDGKILKHTDGKKTVTSYRQTILEQEVDQPPTKLRRVYEKATIKIEGKPDVKEEPFHGKTLLIEKKDGKPTFRIEAGEELFAKDVPSLAKEFAKKDNPNQAWDLLVPKKALAVGETWKLDKKGILKLVGAEGDKDIFVGDFDKAIATGKLVKLYKKDNRQFGILQFEVMLPIAKLKELPLNAGAKVTAKMTADVCIDGSADTGVARAELQMKGEATAPDGVRVDLKGSAKSMESTLEVEK